MTNFFKKIGKLNKSLKLTSLVAFIFFFIYNSDLIFNKITVNYDSTPINFNNIWVIDLSLFSLDPKILFALISFTIIALYVLAQFFSLWSILTGFFLFIGSIAFQMIRNYYLKFDILWKLPFTDQFNIYRVWTDDDKLSLFNEQYYTYCQKNNVILNFDNNEILKNLSSCHRKDEILLNINSYLDSKFIELKNELAKASAKVSETVSNNVNANSDGNFIINAIESSIQNTVNFVINHPGITFLTISAVCIAIGGYWIYSYSSSSHELKIIKEQLNQLDLEKQVLQHDIKNINQTLTDLGKNDLPNFESEFSKFTEQVNIQVKINNEIAKNLTNLNDIQKVEIEKLATIQVNEFSKIQNTFNVLKSDLEQYAKAIIDLRTNVATIARSVKNIIT